MECLDAVTGYRKLNEVQDGGLVKGPERLLRRSMDEEARMTRWVWGLLLRRSATTYVACGVGDDTPRVGWVLSCHIIYWVDKESEETFLCFGCTMGTASLRNDMTTQESCTSRQSYGATKY